MNKKTPSEGKIFNLKPEMTVAMKLAATFAITYYGLLLAFEIVAVVFRRYYFDSYYFNQGEMSLGSWEFVVQIIQLALSVLLVFSLILIFRKKAYGKAFFVSASILLIVFQFIVTGLVPWLKYALEALMVLIIAPLRVKKKIRIKDGKIEVEEVKEPEETTGPEKVDAPEQPDTLQEQVKKEPDA